MKRFLLALALGLGLLATAALAENDDVIARWYENSGSVEPDHAWDHVVDILLNGKVRATYCKGYAEAPPGCATVEKQMSDDQMDAFEADVEALMGDLAAHPPHAVPPEEMQIGGGSLGGWIIIGGQKIDLPAEPVAADAARVAAMLAVLQAHTPKNLVKKAQRRARQP